MVKSRPQRARRNHIYESWSWIAYRDGSLMGGVQVGRGLVGKRRGGVSVQSMGEMGKDFGPNLLQPFLENIDRRSFNDRVCSLDLGRGFGKS